MATLIPSINSCLSRMTSGEKRVARALESNLDQDYLLWYDVPIGSKRRQPDFIILHPQRGLFVLQVKDWKLSTIQQVNHQAVVILTDAGWIAEGGSKVALYGHDQGDRSVSHDVRSVFCLCEAIGNSARGWVNDSKDSTHSSGQATPSAY